MPLWEFAYELKVDKSPCLKVLLAPSFSSTLQTPRMKNGAWINSRGLQKTDQPTSEKVSKINENQITIFPSKLCGAIFVGISPISLSLSLTHVRNDTFPQALRSFPKHPNLGRSAIIQSSRLAKIFHQNRGPITPRGIPVGTTPTGHSTLHHVSHEQQKRPYFP